MPLYDFECEVCKKVHEHVFSMKDDKIPPPCCGQVPRRLFTSRVNGDEFGEVTTIDPVTHKVVKTRGDHFNSSIGEYVTSKSQFERRLKEKGLRHAE